MKNPNEQEYKYTVNSEEPGSEPLVIIRLNSKLTYMSQALETLTGKKSGKLNDSEFFDYITDSQKKREALPFVPAETEISDETKSDDECARLIAEDLLKENQQFMSKMRHEIRTLMNTVIGFTRVVLKTDLSAKQKEYLQAIKVSGDGLIVLVNNLPDSPVVAEEKIVFEQTPFKMANSVSSILRLFEKKIVEKDIEFVSEYDKKIPDVMIGDPARLNQIIINLMSNAIKFTSKGRITVSVNLLSEDEETATVNFAVTDTGIGISKNKMESIFDNFQPESIGISKVYGETGLGLAVVKQLVEQQGGTIHLKSKMGEGSTFSFDLSFMKANAEAQIEAQILQKDMEVKNVKVLIVEDIALNQLLMKILLDEFGFDRDVADNGQMAIEKMKAKSYDVILMDLQMPVMNGFEATEYIRNNMHSNVPIIALTANVTNFDFEKCKEVGMDEFVSKPFDEKVLYNKIVRLIKESRAN